VTPPIAELSPPLPPELLAEAEDAVAELARFDSEIGTTRAPFAAILLRTESASSSEIERITSSARQLALAEIGAARSENARLVVANVHAMHAAIDLAERLDAQAIIAMQRALLGASAPELTGSWRREQVWIGGGAVSPHRADFVPPHHGRVDEAMADLVRFIGRPDLPVLVHVALAHGQFETIHPFPDGNGRTGRALVHGMLRAAGVARNVSIPVSAGLLSAVDEYFAALTAYRAGDIEPIVRKFVDAAFAAVDNGRRLVSRLGEIRAAWDVRITSRRGSAARRLLDHLVMQPAIDVKAVADALGISMTAADRGIGVLESAGVLSRANAARRDRVWQADEILDALDEFAERARRTPHGG